MPDSKKSFPNVESLVIKSNVFEIRIPNSLFPNVKWVQSERDRFETGNCLVLNEGNIFCTLLNTFCKKEGGSDKKLMILLQSKMEPFPDVRVLI